MSFTDVQRRDIMQWTDSTIGNDNLVSAAICILVLISVLCSVLFVIRRVRRTRAAAASGMPLHKADIESGLSSPSASTPSFVQREKEAFLASTYGPPTAAAPAIHLTLPEELEDGSKSAAARIVVVNVGDRGEIGLSPLEHEQLPAYQETSEDRFQSLDLERLGGLKESSRQ